MWMASSDRNLHCFQKVIVNYPKIENALIIKKNTHTHLLLIDKTISTESKIIHEVFGLIVMLHKSLKFEKYIHVMQHITKTKL